MTDDELLKRLDERDNEFAKGNNFYGLAAARIRELKGRNMMLEQMVDGLVGKDRTYVIVPVEQPPTPELPNDIQEFADRHGLGTFLQELWRQAFRTAHRAMIRAAQGSTGGVSSTPEQEGSP